MQIVIILIWLAIVLAYLPLCGAPVSAWRSVVKTIPVLMLSFFCYVTGMGAFLVSGLFFSALGDFGLSRSGNRGFLYGLCAFALAHIAYLLYFLTISDLPLSDVFFVRPFVSVGVLAVMLSTELWLMPYAGKLAWPVRIYVLLIVLMGLGALRLESVAFLSGAGLFILSDLMLALVMFRHLPPVLVTVGNWAIWLSYIAAQVALVIGGVFVSLDG